VLHRQQLTNHDANAIRPILATLSEDANLRPIKPTARMTRPDRYLGFMHQMKEENDFNMRKLSEAQKAVRGKSRTIKINAGLNAAPIVVDGLLEPAANCADRPELKFARRSFHISSIGRQQTKPAHADSEQTVARL